MILISHRGNIEGINKSMENNPCYINIALEMGFHVEIDVWLMNGNILLGHDEPYYVVDLYYLKNEKFLCHAKNRDAFEYMLQFEDIHSFWHQEDHYTLSSRRIPIVYPGKPLLNKCIAMTRDCLITFDLGQCYGVCSDLIKNYR